MMRDRSSMFDLLFGPLAALAGGFCESLALLLGKTRAALRCQPMALILTERQPERCLIISL
jgi:hypothetical protein